MSKCKTPLRTYQRDHALDIDQVKQEKGDEVYLLDFCIVCGKGRARHMHPAWRPCALLHLAWWFSHDPARGLVM
eukprot:3273459-Amphidinium_carterae.1